MPNAPGCFGLPEARGCYKHCVADAERKLTRAERKERTRQQLIDAAAELLRTEGVSAVTTTRITQAVGVTQPAFYVHFRNVDECLSIAAEQLATRMLTLLREARATVRAKPGEDVEGALNNTLQVLLSEPKLVEIFLQYRRDTSSAVGQLLAATYDRARAELAEDMELGAQLLGVPEGVLPSARIQADLLAALALGAIELILDGRAERTDIVRSLMGVVQGVISIAHGAALPTSAE